VGSRAGTAAAVAGAVVALSVSALAHAGSARASGADAAVVKSGLASASAKGVLSADDAARYAAVVDRAVALSRRLPPARANAFAAAVHEAAGLAGRYTTPRALTVFGGLEANMRQLASAPPPRKTADVLGEDGEDGVVYRYFSGRGYQFHPLANFARLNVLAARGDVEGTRRLSAALLARAIPAAGGLVWEYPFSFGGGRAPWTSGMAQAVAAQAFSRAAASTGDSSLLAVATRAYRPLAHSLVRPVTGGLWIRLYSFSSLSVLNAQLQAAVSLAEYAAAAEDTAAQALTAQLEAAAAALLPQFDTGAWSLYSHGGAEASLHYHRYVVSLLKLLADRTGAPVWADAAARFDRYLTEPPRLSPGASSTVLYPLPRDGYRDLGTVTFTISKLARVTLLVGGERRTILATRAGGRIAWDPGFRAVGTYPARLMATDVAGNTATIPLTPFEIRYDADPPHLSATLVASRLVWQTSDRSSPWLRLQLVMDGPGGSRAIPLGRRPLTGSIRLRLPRGTWLIRLFVTDSSGNRTTLMLGHVRR
jgi:D-glucuronyl C5-epimerase-like protein